MWSQIKKTLALLKTKQNKKTLCVNADPDSSLLHVSHTDLAQPPNYVFQSGLTVRTLERREIPKESSNFLKAAQPKPLGLMSFPPPVSHSRVGTSGLCPSVQP